MKTQIIPAFTAAESQVHLELQNDSHVVTPHTLLQIQSDMICCGLFCVSQCVLTNSSGVINGYIISDVVLSEPG